MTWQSFPSSAIVPRPGLLLRRNPEVIAKMAKEGVLKGAKQGQSWFFRRDDLVEYMDKLFETGGTGT